MGVEELGSYSLGVAATAAAFVISAPASAGDTVRYGAPAAWVVPADFAAARATGESVVMIDQQSRLEGGQVEIFSDIAYRIDSPEALTKAGTLQLGWLPDKGDLTVHRIEIYRGAEVIDLVKQGAQYTVLRRERALEKRSLDGALTATLAVPGLKVGDIVRFSQTITNRDQALSDAMQFASPLMTAPLKLGFGRVAVSWPKDTPMKWRAGSGVALPTPMEAGGYRTLSLPLPLAEREDPPQDAPGQARNRPAEHRHGIRAGPRPRGVAGYSLRGQRAVRVADGPDGASSRRLE